MSVGARSREPHGTTDRCLAGGLPERGIRVKREMAQKAIVGEKVGMTQVWDDQNRAVPVTVVRVAPCRVVQVKTPEHDGYSALQVTFGQIKARSRADRSSPWCVPPDHGGPHVGGMRQKVCCPPGTAASRKLLSSAELSRSERVIAG